MRKKSRAMAALLCCLALFCISGCAQTENGEVFRGALRDDAYFNNTFAVTFPLPENWYFLTEEEIAETTEFVRDAFTCAESIQQYTGSSQQYYDTYAATSDGYLQMNVLISVPTPAERFRLKTGGTDALLDATLETLPEMTEGTELENAKVKKAKASFCGETFPCLVWTDVLNTEYGEIPVHRLQVMKVLENNTALMTVTVTTYLEDQTEEVMGFFEPFG